jgi:hypothetical protein
MEREEGEKEHKKERGSRELKEKVGLRRKEGETEERMRR